MKLLRPLIAALMVGVLFGGQATTTSLATTAKSKAKETSVLSKMVNNTKNFVSGIFGGKKTSKKKSSK